MKTLSIKILTLLLLISGALLAQDFEGSIKYAMKVTLPEKQRKEMEQMGYSTMMPNGFEITTKNTVSRMKMFNGKGVMMEIVSQHDKKENYMLDHAEKKAYKLPAETPKSADAPKPKVTKTSETETIAGYKCTKYLVEEPNRKSVQHVWVTKDLKVPVAAFSGGIGSRSSTMMIDGIEGLPLKITFTENGNASEIVATAVNKTKLNTADLQLPSGYAIEPFNPAMIGKMMMGR
jgi:hypothetical protein